MNPVPNYHVGWVLFLFGALLVFLLIRDESEWTRLSKTWRFLYITLIALLLFGGLYLELIVKTFIEYKLTVFKLSFVIGLNTLILLTALRLSQKKNKQREDKSKSSGKGTSHDDYHQSDPDIMDF